MRHLKSTLEILDLRQLKGNLTFKDLKVECVIRGLSFEKVIKGGFFYLSRWLVDNVNEDIDIDLLTQYDDYIENILREKGNDELIHPSLRLSYLGEGSEERDENFRKTQIKNSPDKSGNSIKSKEKDKNGIVKHTKKSLTFKLQKKGYNVDKVIKRVIRRFPDANSKSIKIWYRKSERSEKSTDKTT